MRTPKAIIELAIKEMGSSGHVESLKVFDAQALADVCKSYPTRKACGADAWTSLFLCVGRTHAEISIHTSC